MFAILFEVLLIVIQEEIHHFAGWEGGGGVKGHKNSEQKFVNKLAFPMVLPSALMLLGSCAPTGSREIMLNHVKSCSPGAEVEYPRCGSGPQCHLEGPPPPPPCTLGRATIVA